MIAKTTGQPRTIDALEGITSDYYDAAQRDLLDRWEGHRHWHVARSAARVDPYSKSTESRIATSIRTRGRAAGRYAGVNFASQEYLSLSSHPRVLGAAREAAERFGVHSAGSVALMGLTSITLELELRLADFLGVADATVFPTGWGAGYGTIRTLVREHDHVVIDVLAHACLQEAASVSTRNVHRFPHCSTEGVERRLKRIRGQDPNAGILVVTESVFSMDSDVPDIAALQALCTSYGATLMLDVAHDLGAIGPTGRGYLELQDMVGKVDVVMGSFSKTFASNGGFAATNHPALKLALRYNCGPLTFTNALSPMQAAVVLACLDIIESDEGNERRERLMTNACHMRGAMEDEGFKVLGQPSAIVPVVLGDNPTSRLITSRMLGSGGIVNLVEYPAVARNACRWRIQVMADHTDDDIIRFVRLATRARDTVARTRPDAVPAAAAVGAV